MAKTAGSIRASKWENSIYLEEGIRKEYKDLSEGRKFAIRAEVKMIQSAMYANLKNKKVTLIADSSSIEVGFTRKGVNHVARDAMMTLSGKYMSKSSMINIDDILRQSEYVPTTHQLYKGRKDGIEYFFKYKDKQGRGIYFKVAFDRNTNTKGRYILYAVTDK